MNRKYMAAVAKEKGYKLEVIEQVMSTMTGFIRNTIESGSLRGVMIQGFGKFAVKPYRELKLKEKYDGRVKRVVGKYKENPGSGIRVVELLPAEQARGEALQPKTKDMPKMSGEFDVSGGTGA